MMSGSLKMYRLKPIIIHDFPVELPSCMYRMKDIHSSRNKADGIDDHVPLPNKNLDIFDQVKQFLKSCQEVPGMAELEAKQIEILEQLAELKKQIYSLKCNLNIQNDSNSKGSPIVKQSISNKLKDLPDSIVVSASPTSPPYSIEILQRLLDKHIGLVVTSYLHSSIASLPEFAAKLKTSLESFKPQKDVPVINVKIIWKNINSNTEFLISHSPIAGEVNLLRYISRLTKSQLSYDSDTNSFEIDSLLDQCYLLVRAKTKSEKTGILQLFNKALSKSQWLVGKCQPGILDIAAYSAVKQSLTPSELGANLGKWYDRCQTLVS